MTNLMKLRLEVDVVGRRDDGLRGTVHDARGELRGWTGAG